MIILLIILGLFPSLAWLYFFLKEDIHPEPKKMILKVFLAGALISTLVLFFQIIAKDILVNYLKFFENGFIPFFFLAAIEEIFKFLAAYLVVRKSKFFDEPVDAMIYMIAAALGFAAIENVLVNFGAVFGQNLGIKEIIVAMTLRFVGATLLHSLSSATVGYYWARQKIIIGLFLATILHALFNYFIILSNKALIFPTLFLIIVAMLVFWDFEKIKNNLVIK